MSNDINIDWEREGRTGVPEAVFAESKSNTQLANIINQALARSHPMLFTRMAQSQFDYVAAHSEATLDYDPISKTLILAAKNRTAASSLSSPAPIEENSPSNTSAQPSRPASVAVSSGELTDPTTAAESQITAKKSIKKIRSVGIVAAGTSDIPVATEVMRCLEFFDIPHGLYADVGVAGLWRLTQVQPELEKHALLIAVAGMEGALFSVLSGLVSAPLIAVPTSVGYGVAAGGTVALHSALASCSPGIVTVNIDNGFGAASAARKILSCTELR